MALQNGVHPITALLDNHEERVQRLEDERVEQASQLAEQTTTLMLIKETIADMAQSIKENNKNTELFFAKTSETFSSLSHRVEPLEEAEKQKKTKAQWIRTTIIGILLSGGGFIAGELIKKVL